MYKSVETWRDLTDKHLYNPGDVFPHDGREITPERLNALLTAQNGAKRPLVVRVDNLPTEEPETPKRPRRARKKE